MMLERRKYQREELAEIVRYAPSPTTSDDVLKGLMHNWSCDGFCLTISNELKEGQEIIVKSYIMSAKKATVRWRHHISKSSYMVGLEFVR